MLTVDECKYVGSCRADRDMYFSSLQHSDLNNILEQIIHWSNKWVCKIASNHL